MAVPSEVDRPAPLPVARPWVDSPFVTAELDRRPGTEDQRRLAVDLHERGFVVLRGVAEEALLDRVLAEVAPLYEDPAVAARRRVQDAWGQGCAAVRELAVLPEILGLLSYLYDRRPVPFQTLTFKWGTEQRAHSDCLHFSCLPAGFMCGVWVALEDTDADNGPLFYYPGSHRQPELNLYDLNQTVENVQYHLYETHQEALMRSLGIEPVEFHARKGDALLWSSNIVHGGRPVLDAGRTRWSQVTHYYFEDSVYFTPVHSDFVTGELLLKDIVDLTTMEPVAHRHAGRAVTVLPGANGRSRVAFGGSSGSPGDSPTVRLAQLEARVAELEGLVGARDAEIEQLRTSEAFRAGSMLVRPLARARDALRSR